MDSNDGKIIVSRHGRKFTGMHGLNREDGGIPVKPGSLEDKSFIYITPESAEELRESGKEVAGDQTYDNILILTSDFIRALQSAVDSIEDVNKPNGHYIIQIPELGFGVDNINWGDPRLPKYSDEKEVEYAWIKTLLEGFSFKPEEPGLPFMGKMMYHYYKALEEGLKYLQQNQGQEQSLLPNFTHAPNIDTFVAGALNCLDIDQKHKVVEVNDNYRGAVAMGEMFTGNIYNLSSDNPSIDLIVKGKDVGYKLSDLQRKKQEIYEMFMIA